MMTTANDLVHHLIRLATVATEKGAAARCSVHLRVESGWLLIVTYARDGSGRQSARLVSWNDVLTVDGAVARD
jgi:hypothetical protein